MRWAKQRVKALVNIIVGVPIILSTTLYQPHSVVLLIRCVVYFSSFSSTVHSTMQKAFSRSWEILWDSRELGLFLCHYIQGTYMFRISRHRLCTGLFLKAHFHPLWLILPVPPEICPIPPVAAEGLTNHVLKRVPVLSVPRDNMSNLTHSHRKFDQSCLHLGRPSPPTALESFDQSLSLL